MSATLELIRSLVRAQKVRVSNHGYDELATDDLTVDEVLNGIGDAIVVEDYPDFAKGPAVLVLEVDRSGQPIHVVWGVQKGTTEPAVLVTAYRPDAARWSDDFLRRVP